MLANWRLAGIIKDRDRDVFFRFTDTPDHPKRKDIVEAMNSGTPNSNPVSVHNAQKTCDTANAMSVCTPPRRTIDTVERWMGSA